VARSQLNDAVVQMVTELRLRSLRLTNLAAKAIAQMLRSNSTIRILDLEDNKFDSDGIEMIAAALAVNTGLNELLLLHNREPGERALSTLQQSLQSNVTLTAIRWRLTSRQSFAINKCLVRNIEIKRRLAVGLDSGDIDPRPRRDSAPAAPSATPAANAAAAVRSVSTGTTTAAVAATTATAAVSPVISRRAATDPVAKVK
jgi:hypothetical protein